MVGCLTAAALAATFVTFFKYKVLALPFATTLSPGHRIGMLAILVSLSLCIVFVVCIDASDLKCLVKDKRRRLLEDLRDLLHRNPGLEFSVLAVLFLLFGSVFVVCGHAFAPTATADETASSFVEWFGVPYGLIAALILVQVWVQREGAHQLWDDEIDAQRELVEFAETLKKPQPLLTVMVKYVEHLRKNDQFEMESCDDSDALVDSGDQILRELHKKVVAKFKKYEEEREVLIEVARRVVKLIDVRGDRVQQSQQRVPVLLRSLLVYSSAIWVACLAAPSEAKWTVFFLQFAAVYTVVLLVVVVVGKLDKPFAALDLHKEQELASLRKPLDELMEELTIALVQGRGAAEEQDNGNTQRILPLTPDLPVVSPLGLPNCSLSTNTSQPSGDGTIPIQPGEEDGPSDSEISETAQLLEQCPHCKLEVLFISAVCPSCLVERSKGG